jgi:release factor glutamine methyltransferase
VRLVTLPGVFRPISDTWLLADALEGECLPAGARVLDLCSGSGVLAIRAARRAEVTAVDISRRSIATIRLNAALNGVRVRAVRGDLLAAVPGERFDAIVSNPPYVPAPADDVPARGRARAWDAGRDGRALLDRICARAPARLRPGGSLVVVHSSVCDAGRTLQLLAEGGLAAEIVVRSRGPLGPLLSERRTTLQQRGQLAPDVHEEDLVLIRGRRSAEPA